jgi:hypothetical protein
MRDGTVARLAFTAGWRMARGAQNGASSEDRAAGDAEAFEALDDVEAMRAHAQIAREEGSGEPDPGARRVGKKWRGFRWRVRSKAQLLAVGSTS